MQEQPVNPTPIENPLVTELPTTSPLSSTTPQPTKKKSGLGLVMYIILIAISGYFFFKSYNVWKNKDVVLTSNKYACSPDGECLIYPYPVKSGVCPVEFTSQDCDGQCDDLVKRCDP